MMRRKIEEEESDRNRDYKFSEEDIQFLRKLNEKLRKEELRFLTLHDQLKPQLTALCNQQVIDDFKYEMDLTVFAKDRKCNARHDVEYGDPILEDKIWRLFTGEGDRKLLDDNWIFQFTGKDHPLSDVPCCTMYRIVYSRLLWEDILCIDDVWLELKIHYQFLSNDKEKRRRFHKLNKQRIAEGRLL